MLLASYLEFCRACLIPPPLHGPVEAHPLEHLVEHLGDGLGHEVADDEHDQESDELGDEGRHLGPCVLDTPGVVHRSKRAFHRDSPRFWTGCVVHYPYAL